MEERDVLSNEIQDLYGEFELKLNKDRKFVKTTVTPSGQIFDWMKIESQNPEGKISKPPLLPIVSNPRWKDQLTRFELESPAVSRGPKGSVPILRDKKIYPKKSFPLPQVPAINNQHLYCAVSKSVNNYGCSAYLSSFRPYVQWEDEFSLLQIAVSSNSTKGDQTVEAGLIVYKDINKDLKLHLFTYYTTNGYTNDGDKAGGYNTQFDGWVQNSKFVTPGCLISSNSISTVGGDQYATYLEYRLFQGDWWLNCDGRWIGYYPSTLFNNPGLRTGGKWVHFYGEVVDSGSHAGDTNTNMGSGEWPSKKWKKAAYLRNLSYLSNIGYAELDTQLSQLTSDKTKYDMEPHMQSGTSWKSYFWLGGPGKT
jgi:neprosin-like protein